jgi:uncharacterized membrane protein YphA (DoxX/SURF4 family)
MLASMFVTGGINSLRNAPAMAPAAKPVADTIVPLAQRAGIPLPEDPATLVRIDGAIQLAAGAMLATGRLPRLSALVLAATLVPTTAAGHAFWKAPTPGVKADQKIHFFKNVSMIGGLLMSTLDPDPHKKVLVLRAKDAAVDAGGAVREAAVNANKRAEKAAKKVRRQSRRSSRRAAKSLR